MEVTKREIERAVLRPLKSAGWRTKGRSAYKAGLGMSVVVNVQGSRFDSAQFVNIGFYFPDRPDEQLVHNKCPVLFRIEDLRPEHRAQVLQATAEESSSLEALEWLEDFVSRAIEPELSALLTQESLRAALQSERLKGARVTVQARTVLRL